MPTNGFDLHALPPRSQCDLTLATNLPLQLSYPNQELATAIAETCLSRLANADADVVLHHIRDNLLATASATRLAGRPRGSGARGRPRRQGQKGWSANPDAAGA